MSIPKPSLHARNRHIASNALGSTLIAVGAVSVGWLPPLFNLSVNPILEALRLSDFGPVLGRTAAVIGGAIILHTWLRAGVDILRNQIESLTTLWGMLIASLIPVLLVPPLFSRDVYSYIAQGRLFANGINPYTHGVSALPGWFQIGAEPMWADSPTPYGPIFLLIQKMIALGFPMSPWWAMLTFKLLCIISVFAIGSATVKLAEMHGINPRAAMWLSVLNPLVLFHLVIGIHNDALMMAFMMWAFVYATRKNALVAILLITAAAGIKPIALVALPFIGFALVARDASWKRVIISWITVTVSTLGLLAGLGFALNVGVGWVSALSTPGSVRTLLAPSTAVGQLIGALGNIFGADITDSAISIMHTVFMVAALIFIARITLRPGTNTPLRLAGLVFTTLVLLSPVIQSWYLLWALPLIAATGLKRVWHLRAIVLGIGFFVVYALAEINVVSDSAIDLTDILSIAASIAVVVTVLVASPRERELITGEHLGRGLQPETDADFQILSQLRLSIGSAQR